MKLETPEVLARFGIEKAAYYARLTQQFDFLVGKYFGLKGKDGRRDRYFGKIENVRGLEDYNSFTSKFLMKLEINYYDKKGDWKTAVVVFEDGLCSQNRVLVYGDDEDSVKLELICTE